MIPIESMRQKTLDVLAVGAQFVASEATLEVDRGAYMFVADRIAFQLRSYVLADHLAHESYTRNVMWSYPATTWHMFRKRHESAWWQRWLGRRRPILMKVESEDVVFTVDRYLTYPDAAIRVPHMGPFKILERVSDEG